MTAKRRYIFENLLNFRDIGGYPSLYGTTKFRRMYRSGVTAPPTASDIEKLKELNIRTVIDLRGDTEAEDCPLGYERIGGINYYHISLYEKNMAASGSDDKYENLLRTYSFIIDNYKSSIAKILEVIADADDGPIMYHCFFGKDRTGIITMLLLSIAGVSQEDIIADYQQSYIYLKAFIETHRDILWSADDRMHYSLPETMLALIEHINSAFGSVDGYLDSAGISRETKEKIRKKLID